MTAYLRRRRGSAGAPLRTEALRLPADALLQRIANLREQAHETREG